VHSLVQINKYMASYFRGIKTIV